MLNVMALHTAMLGVCISTYLDATIFKIIQILMTKESIPATCLIQQEGTLMSVLGYIVMTILVSLFYFTDLDPVIMLFTFQLWFNIRSLYCLIIIY